jgi:hypothetical protein
VPEDGYITAFCAPWGHVVRGRLSSRVLGALPRGSIAAVSAATARSSHGAFDTLWQRERALGIRGHVVTWAANSSSDRCHGGPSKLAAASISVAAPLPIDFRV